MPDEQADLTALGDKRDLLRLGNPRSIGTRDRADRSRGRKAGTRFDLCSQQTPLRRTLLKWALEGKGKKAQAKRLHGKSFKTDFAMSLLPPLEAI